MVPHITSSEIGEIALPKSYKKIAIGVDFSTSDRKSVASALQIGGKKAVYTLVHVVETPGAMIYGNQIKDFETSSDKKILKDYKAELEKQG